MTIGIITAAGRAERIYGLPKYLLPVPGGYLLDAMCKRMKPVSENILIVSNDDNRPIVSEYTPNRARVYSVKIGTMCQALLDSWTSRKENVICGMSDSYWTDEYVYKKLIANLESDNSIVSLALFEARDGQHTHVGMCYFDEEPYGSRQCIIHDIVDKPIDDELTYCWGAMAWKPAFWKYIVASDPHVGFAAQRAIDAGETVTGVVCDGDYWDCGEPNRYFEMIRTITK